MIISASINSSFQRHAVSVSTDGSSKEVCIAPKTSGFGSSVNGGELLLLALATCFCNDVYREAAGRNIIVDGVEVIVTAEFGAPGEPGTNFKYKATVNSGAPKDVIEELIRHTDKVAEIHNTLRKGISIELE